MRYLITGHTGFIGSNLLDILLKDKNNKVLCIGRDNFDVNTIKRFEPEYIFHFAAEIYNESKMIDSNIILTQKLLDATKNISYKKFIHIGSSSEYGYNPLPMHENDILEPRTMYEATKGAATLLCQAHSNTYNKNIVVVRPFSVYGRYEKEHRFIPTLFRKFESKQEVTISEGVHDFIHIDDFIDAMLKIAFIDNNDFDIINIGSGIQTSNLEVFEIFCKLFKYRVSLNQIETKLREFDSNHWVANIDKLEHRYNFAPKYNLEEGLKQEYAERIK